MRRALVLIALAACGDDLQPKCDPELRNGPSMPPYGPFADPLAIELPDCVAGGLSDAVGRWFVRDDQSLFNYSYPLLEPACEGGARIQGITDDHNLEDDNVVFHTWWDDTRFYRRQYYRFEVTGFVFENATAEAFCLMPDGTLGGVWVHSTSDMPEPITGPLVGTRFGRKAEDVAHGLELVGQLRVATGRDEIVAFNLAVDGGFAYVNGPSGFYIVDVSNPATPRLVASLAEPWNDVRVVHAGGKTVAIGASFVEEATIIVDVTDPTAPQVATKIDSYSHSLQVAGNKLYLADYSNTVPIYDITDPFAPVLVDLPTVPDSDFGIHDLTVDGDRLFVNQTEAGFVALDLAAPTTKLARMPSTYSHASWVGTTTSGRRLVLHGDEGLTYSTDGAAFLRVLDGDPASPTFMQELGRYQSRPEVGIHNIEMHGDRAYIAYYQDGVRVVDLSDPTQPREIAHYNTWDPAADASGPFVGALGIRVVDGLIYVADSERGLVILRETL
jgi:hypothetical protein